MLKRKKCNVKPTKFLKSYKKVRFYSIFPSLTSFTALHNILEPMVVSVVLERSNVSLQYAETIFFQKPRTFRKLSSYDELLLTLMKICFWLLDAELANRLSFSVSYVARILVVTTIVKGFSKCLDKLVYFPPKEVVYENLPSIFKTIRYSSDRHIIDCTRASYRNLKV